MDGYKVQLDVCQCGKGHQTYIRKTFQLDSQGSIKIVQVIVDTWAVG